MRAAECVSTLDYQDPYLLFNRNTSLYEIIASLVEKDNLIA